MHISHTEGFTIFSLDLNFARCLVQLRQDMGVCEIAKCYATLQCFKVYR